MKIGRMLGAITACGLALVAPGMALAAASVQPPSRSSSVVAWATPDNPALPNTGDPSGLTPPATPPTTQGANPTGIPGDPPTGAPGTMGTGPYPSTAAPLDQPNTPAQPHQVPVPPVVALPADGPAPRVVFLPMASVTQRGEFGDMPRPAIAVMAGGGAFDFVGGDIKAATRMGGFWNVRALIGSRSLISIEAAYLGTAQSIQAPGLGSDARLLSNGVEGALRLNAPLGIGRLLLEPFGFAGAGWSRYSVVNTDTQSASLRSSDDVITVPVGGGLSLGYAGFFVDARYTYRFTYDHNLVVSGDGQLDNWNLGGAIGFEF
jgi:hypothetical protein